MSASLCLQEPSRSITEVPAELASKLLRAPVDSRTGLGIGLYQAARQAEAAGFQLALRDNRDGEVCFALTGPATPP